MVNLLKNKFNSHFRAFSLRCTGLDEDDNAWGFHIKSPLYTGTVRADMGRAVWFLNATLTEVASLKDLIRIDFQYIRLFNGHLLTLSTGSDIIGPTQLDLEYFLQTPSRGELIIIGMG